MNKTAIYFHSFKSAEVERDFSSSILITKLSIFTAVLKFLCK